MPDRSLLLLPLLWLLSCGSGMTPEDPDPALRVLFIGNSLTYTNDLPGMLGWMLAETGTPAGVAAVAKPNYGLEDHWRDGEARARLAEGWDVVVLQQGPSATEGRPSLLEYSARFAAEIRAAGARPALYMVWPSERRRFDFDGVSASYRMAADTIDGLLFPAGEAWRAAWRRDPLLPLYGPDGFHPSPTGTYLAALVLFSRLSDADPADLPATIPAPGGDLALSTERAFLLRQAAHEANDAFAR